MNFQFFPTHSVMLADLQRLAQKIIALLRNRLEDFNGLYIDLLNNIFDTFDLVPWCFSEQKLIIKNPDRPNIAFIGILAGGKQLRSHIERGSDCRGVFEIFHFFYFSGEAKIT